MTVSGRISPPRTPLPEMAGPMTLKFVCAAFASLFLVTGCGDNSQRVAFVQDGEGWKEISLAEARALQRQEQEAQDLLSQAPPELLEAIERNPSEADVLAQINDKDLTELTQEDFANLSVIIAKEVCNIPDGQDIDPTTPCEF